MSYALCPIILAEDLCVRRVRTKMFLKLLAWCNRQSYDWIGVDCAKENVLFDNIQTMSTYMIYLLLITLIILLQNH